MNKLLMTSVLMLGSVFTMSSSATDTAESDIYGCDFAAQTAEDSVENKRSGVSLDIMKQLFKNIPDSQNKDMYVYYSKFGYLFDNKKIARNEAFKYCTQNS